MKLDVNRRAFLGSSLVMGAAIITPDRAMAGAAPAGWTLGVADVEADIAPTNLTLIEGRAPKDFSGTLYRNGPAKFRRGGGTSGHWFDGDGLIRKFQIREGKAMVAARFVDTPKRRLESKLDAIVQPGFGSAQGAGAVVNGPDDTNAANTAMLMAGGELMALWEGGSPTLIDKDSLQTRGFKTFRQDLKQMPFLAHPRVQPDGTVWNLGGGGAQAIVWKLAPNGTLAKAEMLKLPRRSYFHDFTATARHLVIVLQPWLQEKFKFPLSTSMVWRPEMGTQVLVVDKDDLTKQRIFELPAFSFFHLGDAWEERDGTIRFDGCLEANPLFGQRSASALLRGEHVRAPSPILTQIILHPNGKAQMHSAGIAAEFPTNDKRLAGLPRRFTAHVGKYRSTPFPHGIGLWDWQKGRDDSFDFGDHQLVEEFLFAPTGAGEREGWLLGTTLNLKERRTELHVIDAKHVKSGPVVSWRVDMPLPLSFHGIFVGG
jgi:all-trans-8'-apo-beta-carotenal 15,15'-oxygenase